MVPLLPPYCPRTPAVETIWVIVPFSRPEQLSFVVDNFTRQRFPGKKLCLVENGRAVGACTQYNVQPDLLLTSEQHQAIAKNTALAEIRARGGGFFAAWDDDDWYGPEYLAELAGAARDAELVGKNAHFVDVGGDMLLCHRDRIGYEAPYLAGSGLAGFAEAVGFYPVQRVSEDIDFCLRLRSEGARILNLSPYHYLVRRYYEGARHTWSIAQANYLLEQRGAWALSLGPPDEAIVTGERPITRTRLIGEREFRPYPSG